MLNELLIVERGVQQAGLPMALGHKDVKGVAKIPTLVVGLDSSGRVAWVRPLSPDAKPWTLRDAQQNSFPFVRPQQPLWAVSDARREELLKKRHAERRAALLARAEVARFNNDGFAAWPGDALKRRIRERRQQLGGLAGSEAEVVLATMDRFLVGCGATGDGSHLLQAVATKLLGELGQAAQDSWLDAAAALLVGKKQKDGWKCGGALLFEADGSPTLIIDAKVAMCVGDVLSRAEYASVEGNVLGVDGLTGGSDILVSRDFHQPKLPVLGQTFLFAKNVDIPANDRYRRFGAKAMPVGQETARRLAAALETITAPELRGVTWRPVPGEAPKQNDLLLAFVEAAPDVPTASALTDEDVEQDVAEEAADLGSSGADSIAAFEKRTRRMFEAVRARVAADFRHTPVRLAVLRKVDPANRKVVYAGAPTVGDLYDAATRWAGGERNVPPWLTLPIFPKGHREPVAMTPLHISPLGLIAFSKQLFVRHGTAQQEIVGLPAAEALGLFLDSADTKLCVVRGRARRFLRMVLVRRSGLAAGVAHVRHAPRCWRRRGETLKKFDHREALRTVTLLGVLLDKLGRTKEEYMSDAAFTLGQLLAAADVVHAGYCADVRGGNVPPSLLGNQVFSTAQTAPAKALAILSLRWKPYDGWAKRTAHERKRIDGLVASKNKEEQQRGWDVRKALRHAREMGPLADQLAPLLSGCAPDDSFRAELLLGYLAGLPKAEKGQLALQEETLSTEPQ